MIRSRPSTDCLFSILVTDCTQTRDRSAHLRFVTFRWLALVWFSEGRDGLQLTYSTWCQYHDLRYRRFSCVQWKLSVKMTCRRL